MTREDSVERSGKILEILVWFLKRREVGIKSFQ
jgi:hypothetical protein